MRSYDFYHASEYLAYASKVLNLRNKEEQKEWLNDGRWKQFWEEKVS